MTERQPPAPFSAPASQSDHGWEVRTQILRAAQEVAEARGHAGLRIRDVASKAHVSPALVIRHFPTKADLLLTLFIEHAETEAEALRKSTAGYASPRARAEGFLRAVFRRDLAVKDLTAEIMSYSWTWSVEHERWLRDYEAIYIGHMVRLLEPLADEARRRTAATMFLAGYARELRRAVHAGGDVEGAMAGLSAELDFVFAAL